MSGQQHRFLKYRGYVRQEDGSMVKRYETADGGHINAIIEKGAWEQAPTSWLRRLVKNHEREAMKTRNPA